MATKEQKRERLGDYELIETIGDGAQGKVFRARHLKPKGNAPPFVAMKLLRLMGQDEDKVERFYHQANILKDLSHPNIVRYLDTFTWNAGEWDESHCMVMEYLEGDTLAGLIRRHPRGIPLPRVKEIFERCLEALVYARSQGVVHRDIKPSNIFVTSDETVKIIDFDIARHEQSGQLSTVGWKGTFDYMAPDFVNVAEFRGDEQSDLFSLGVCFCQALTGSLPFPPLGEGAQIGYLNRWRDPSSVEVSCDEGVFNAFVNARTLAKRSTHPNREQRYRTFGEFLDDLRRVKFRTLEHKHKDTYEMVGWWARSGVAEVFEGRRVSDGMPVAIKQILVGGEAKDYIHGVRVLQRYPHPGIFTHLDFLAVHGKTSSSTSYFLVMKHLPGMPAWTLRMRLQREKRLRPSEALPLFCQYLSSLQFMHEDPKPIFHSDIRPSNLYAPPRHSEFGKLSDPGIDKHSAKNVDGPDVSGFLDYTAPEISDARSARGSAKSDIHALGLCLYEALTGRPPQERLPSCPGEAWKVFEKNSASPRSLPFGDAVFKTFPRLQGVIEKATAHDPINRYESAADMRMALEQILRHLKEAQPEEETLVEAPTEPTGAIEELAMITAMPSDEEGSVSSTDWSAMRTRDCRRRRVLSGGAILLIVAVVGAGGYLLNDFLRTVQAPLRAAGSGAAPSGRSPRSILRVDGLVQELPPPAPRASYVAALTDALRQSADMVKDNPAVAAEAESMLKTLENLGSSVPTLFRTEMDKAVDAGDVPGAERLLDEWGQIGNHLKTLVISKTQYARQGAEMATTLGLLRARKEADAIQRLIPPALDSDGTLAAAAKAFTQLSEAQDRTWEGLTKEQKKRVFQPAEEALRVLASGRIRALRDEAERLFRQKESREAVQQALRAMETASPGLTAMAEAERRLLLADLEGMDTQNNTLISRLNAAAADIPQRVSGDRDMDQAERAAIRLAELQKEEWSGIPDAEKERLLGAAQKDLQVAMSLLVERIRDDAIGKYRSGKVEDAEKSRRVIETLSNRAPTAMAGVKSRVSDALSDVDAARQAAGSAPSVTAGVDIAEFDPNRQALLDAIESGDGNFFPEGRTDLDTARMNTLVACCKRIRDGFNPADLVLSQKPADDLIADAGDAWVEASLVEGPFGDALRDRTWTVIHDQLAAQAARLATPGLLRLSPSQLGQCRAEFLKLLLRVEDVTARVSGCGPGDELHDRVKQFFAEPFGERQILLHWSSRNHAGEARIPWLRGALNSARAR